VSRRDNLGVERGGAFDERRELEARVAVDARNGCAARRVFADEVVDDGASKLFFEVDDVVREADGVGHASRILQIPEAAARAPRIGGVALVVQLHRKADDIVPLLGEQHGCDGRIDTTRHGHHDTHD
jgi:hypothetical protein